MATFISTTNVTQINTLTEELSMIQKVLKQREALKSHIVYLSALVWLWKNPMVNESYTFEVDLMDKPIEMTAVPIFHTQPSIAESFFFGEFIFIELFSKILLLILPY